MISFILTHGKKSSYNKNYIWLSWVYVLPFTNSCKRKKERKKEIARLRFVETMYDALYNQIGWDTVFSTYLPCQTLKPDPVQRTNELFFLDFALKLSWKTESSFCWEDIDITVFVSFLLFSFFSPPAINYKRRIKNLENRFEHCI